MASSFVSQYIRDAINDKGKRESVVERLTGGEPFVDTEFAVIALIDISGYSKITASLEALYGKLSSELVTTTVRAYFDEIINEIISFGGDIVKFLGDAVLVSFRPRKLVLTDDDETAVMDRAVTCCAEILTKHPHKRVDFSVARAENRTSEPKRAMTKGRKDGIDEGQYFLRLHIALTAGPVRNCVIGSIRKRLDYVIFGECFRELGPLLDSAKAGEVALSPSIRKRLASFPKWKDLLSSAGGTFSDVDLRRSNTVRSGGVSSSHHSTSAVKNVAIKIIAEVEDENSEEYPPLPTINQPESSEPLKPLHLGTQPESGSRMLSANSATSIDAPSDSIRNEILEKFVNEAIMARLKSSNDKSIQNEFRTVSVLFLKLFSEFDANVGHEAMNLFLEALERFGGVFQQYTVDDKGQTLLGERAIAAARLFRRRFQACDFVLSVTSGDILLARLGNRSRSETGLLGHVVNQAARLMGLVKEGRRILCDTQTKVSTPSFRFSLFGNVSLKGNVATVDVWEIENDEYLQSDDELAMSVLHGRTKERQKVREAFETWRAGREVALVYLEGGSGLGKTAIVTELCEDCLHDIPNCFLRISKENYMVPYSGLWRLMQFLLRLNDGNSDRRQKEGARLSRLSVSIQSFSNISDSYSVTKLDPKNALAELVEDTSLLPLFNGLLPGSVLEENEYTASLSQSVRRAIIEKCFLDICTRVSKSHPFCIVFDDFQWIDTLSFRIVCSLLEAYQAKIFIIITSRPPTEIKTPLHESLALPETSCVIKLGILSREDIAEFVMCYSRLQCSAVDQDVVDKFSREKFDSPLVLRNIVELLVNVNAFVVSDGTLMFRSDKAEDIDESLKKNVSQAILTRFDQLDSEFRRVLRRASAFGQYFKLLDLHELVSIEKRPLFEMFRKFDKFEFCGVSDGDSLDTIEFFFKHLSTATAIYETLSFTEKGDIHAEIGGIYERRLSPSNRHLLLPTIVNHYSKSLLDLKYIQYAEELGSSLPLATGPALAKWYSLYTFGAARNFFWTEALEAGKKSLKLVGIDIDFEKEAASKLLVRSAWRQFVLFRKTNGGRRGKRLTDAELNAIETAERTLEALSYMFLSSEKDIVVKALIFLELMNASIQLATVDPAKWASRAIFASLLSQLPSAWLSKIYQQAAETAMLKCQPHHLLDFFPWFLIKEMGSRNLEKLHRFSDLYLTTADKYGEVGHIQFWNRPFTKAEQLLTQHLQAISKLDRVSYDVSLFYLMKAAVACDVPEKARHYAFLMMGNRDDVPVNFKSRLSDVPTKCIEVWIALVESNFEKGLQYLEEFAKLTESYPIINYLSECVPLASHAAWLLMTNFRPTPSSKRVDATILEVMKCLQKPFSLFAKRSYRYWLTYQFFIAIISFLKGKTKRCIHILNQLTKPKVLDHIADADPDWAGLWYAALFLLKGEREDLRKSLQWFQRIEAKFFMRWIKSQQPFGA
ncbi:hypothetical protein HDU96_004685 [Phlyctochytrium bullatum]|nr:hypothetical protein HDU96_004685 [Phlyctochytrium bullatum]